jgi:hypothetical protein
LKKKEKKKKKKCCDVFFFYFSKSNFVFHAWQYRDHENLIFNEYNLVFSSSMLFLSKRATHLFFNYITYILFNLNLNTPEYSYWIIFSVNRNIYKFKTKAEGYHYRLSYNIFNWKQKKTQRGWIIKSIIILDKVVFFVNDIGNHYFSLFLKSIMYFGMWVSLY